MENLRTAQEIRELFDAMSQEELIEYWNEYCEEINNIDNQIYPLDEMDTICDSFSALELFQRLYYGDVRFTDDYFTFNGYGNIDTFRAHELANYIYIDEMIEFTLKLD